MFKGVIFEKYARDLKEKQPHLTLLWYAGWRSPDSYFNDETYGVFKGRYSGVIRGQKKHPYARKYKKNTLEEANLKLQKKFPYLTLLFFIRRKNPNAVFWDDQYGRFVGCFGDVIGDLKHHPERGKDSLRKNGKSQILKLYKTVKEKYGVSHAMHIPKVRGKFLNTMNEKFRGNGPQSDPVINEKNIQTRIRNGSIKLIENKLVSEICTTTGANVSEFNRIYRETGQEEALKYAENYKKTISSLESIVQCFLETLNINFIHGKGFGKCKPDFRIPDHRLIIECDGLAFHSNFQYGKTNEEYHKNKRVFYSSEKYCSFFFREDEIRYKLNIVKNLILKKLDLLPRIYAADCEIKQVDFFTARSFFKENYLSKQSAGFAFGLFYKEELVSLAQFYCFGKKGFLINGFCSKIGVNVIGALEKILNHINVALETFSIDLLLDLRFEDEEEILRLGFIKKYEKVSYKITDLKNTAFPCDSSSSLSEGKPVYKIYDCGQARFSSPLINISTSGII